MHEDFAILIPAESMNLKDSSKVKHHQMLKLVGILLFNNCRSQRKDEGTYADKRTFESRGLSIEGVTGNLCRRMNRWRFCSLLVYLGTALQSHTAAVIGHCLCTETKSKRQQRRDICAYIKRCLLF